MLLMPARILRIAIALLLVVGVASSANARPRFPASDSTAWVRTAVQAQQPAPTPTPFLVQPSAAPPRSWVENGIQGSPGSANAQVAATATAHLEPGGAIRSTGDSQFAPIKQVATSAMQPISRISSEVVMFQPVGPFGQVLAVPEPPSILAVAIFATGLLALSCLRRRRLSANLHPCKIFQHLDD